MKRPNGPPCSCMADLPGRIARRSSHPSRTSTRPTRYRMEPWAIPASTYPIHCMLCMLDILALTRCVGMHSHTNTSKNKKTTPTTSQHRRLLRAGGPERQRLPRPAREAHGWHGLLRRPDDLFDLQRGHGMSGVERKLTDWLAGVHASDLFFCPSGRTRRLPSRTHAYTSHEKCRSTS